MDSENVMQSSEYPLVSMVDDHEHPGSQDGLKGKAKSDVDGANDEVDDASKSGSDADPKAEKPKQVGFFQLFRFADKLDLLLIVIGMCKLCLLNSCAAMGMPCLAWSGGLILKAINAHDAWKSTLTP